MSQRSSGILAHPTSFPSAYGIGDFGQGAYDFIDFLHESEQRLWQVLPLVPTSYGDSPYQSFSTFAGNTLLISPEQLMFEGYLTAEELENPPCFDPRKVDYGHVIGYKDSLYRKAFKRVDTVMSNVKKSAFRKFCKLNAGWLDEFVFFIACKRHLIEERKYRYEPVELTEYRDQTAGFMTDSLIIDCFYGAAWSSWPEALKERDPKTLAKWSSLLEQELKYQKFLQFIFFSQWQALRSYANKLNIKIIGDIPIFVAFDSSDVWANRKGFELDPDGYPIVVSGVPPDYFCETGQLWGNPIYDWEEHKRTGFKWWIARMKSCLEMYDYVRIDHFRGFDGYWAVPYGDTTAVGGCWKKGPGKSLFTALEHKLGELPIIAEDLGVITPPVVKLREKLGYPGMKVLQFAFDDTAANAYLPHNYNSTNAVVYSGTHDNDTSLGWYAGSSAATQDRFRRYMDVSGEDVAWDMIRLAFSSVADYAIVPLQDVMALGSTDRMNIPGTAAGNWQFRYTSDMLNTEMSNGLRYLARMYNRAGFAR